MNSNIEKKALQYKKKFKDYFVAALYENGLILKVNLHTFLADYMLCSIPTSKYLKDF